jgi:GTP-binding protein
MKPVAFKPVVVIVGRPNVGKSTLFNRLTRSRDALVADLPGLTRDRHYGEGRVGDHPFIVVDTGGFEPVAKEGIMAQMAKQTVQAMVEADVVIFLTDGRVGLTGHDREIGERLRKSSRKVVLAINKAEGISHATAAADFYALGLGEPHPISAAHGDGVTELIEIALEGMVEPLPEPEEWDGYSPIVAAADDEFVPIDPLSHRVKLAIVGRPNVGKSTLVNTLLGEERVIAFDQPGTTRDAIEIDFERGGRSYTLIDTAGLRKRGKVFEAIEKFSVIKTLQAIEASNVVLLMLDASAEISDQDAHIAGFVLETGRALVVGVNKWDSIDSEKRDEIKRELERKLRFLSFAKVHHISALKSSGINPLLKSVLDAHAAAFAKLSTPKLTRELQEALEQQQPPRRGIFRPKMRYAHQGGQNPPLIVIHGNGLDDIPDSYRRYLESRFRETFKLQGTPLRIEFRTSDNPYKDKAPVKAVDPNKRPRPRGRSR